MNSILLRVPLAVGAAFLFSATAAYATPFVGTDTVTVHSSDPGLVIQTDHGAGSPGTINVDVAVNGGSTALTNIFRLWTNEDAVNGDDQTAYPIVVNFSFTVPAAFGVNDKGTTVGQETGFLGFYQNGKVQWTDPVSVETSFGTVTIDLSDEIFNQGVGWGLDGGKSDGAEISGSISAIPEPISLALLGSGLGFMGWRIRRRVAD